MSGHSKWATIKRKKAKTDDARGRMFTKLIKEITVAARQGGGDETSNSRLRTAISSAKAANMPMKNIENAILRGTGELPGVTYEEVSYEGYGPGGVAILVETMTDNRKRTVSDIRHLLSKYGGSMGETGCVSWMFEKKGLIVVDSSDKSEDEIMEAVLEAGAEDITEEKDGYEIITDVESFEDVKNALIDADITIVNSELTMIPQNVIKLEGSQVQTILRLMEVLEEHDDVQNVYANFDIDDEEIK